MDMHTQRDPQQIGGGIFLIGLALLFLTGWWWPGIMFVIGASMLARTIAEGDAWQSNRGALMVILIGVIFGLPSSFINADLLWPLLLIGAGLFMLFGGDYRPDLGKRKNDDAPDDRRDDADDDQGEPTIV